MPSHRTSEMLLGALVSDAACLGLHWIYDADRIAEITVRQGGECAFSPPEASNYEGVPSYFAHGARRNGSLTQYGEVLKLAITSMNAKGGDFDVAAYQAAFVAHFGPGGTYQGYIDRPTKGALTNIAAETSPSGVDDDQNPAVARLPAIVARYHGTPECAAMIRDAMEVTNVNEVALAYNAVFADVLSAVIEGKPLQVALEAAAQSADAAIQGELADALETAEQNSTDYAGHVGRACHLPTAGPVMFHILKHSASYSEAINRNILAGGDNAGRSLMIGAIMAGVHGVGSPDGIPLDWVLKLEDAPAIWAACRQLGQIG